MAAGLRHYEAVQRSLQGGHCVLNWGLGRHLLENKVEHQNSSLVADPSQLQIKDISNNVLVKFA